MFVVMKEKQQQLRHVDPKNQCGFTLIEVLVTMLLLTIVLLGTAALQINTVRQGTVSKNAGEAVRLAQMMMGRYKATRYSNILSTGGDFYVELKKDGATQMRNVGLDGESEGPFTVETLVEPYGAGFIITVRVSWTEARPQSQGGSPEYRTANVVLSTQRYQ